MDVVILVKLYLHGLNDIILNPGLNFVHGIMGKSGIIPGSLP